VLAVRWYLRFGLSYRDVEELLTKRGVKVDHVIIYRWVPRFAPLLADAGHAATPWVTASFGSSTSAAWASEPRRLEATMQATYWWPMAARLPVRPS